MNLVRSRVIRPLSHIQVRGYKVLSIETSCDDTCVALIERSGDKTELIEHIKSTLDSKEQGGIIPTRAFDHHQLQIAQITRQLFVNNGVSSHNPPDLICVTRGPGMKGSLSIGLDFAKGLATAFNKPMIGVHHMLGHLLIPRFESSGTLPEFPFLSLLISGGHTMIVLSKSLLEHEILCETIDVAAGDALDKCARELLLKGTNLGKELETFASSVNNSSVSKSFEFPKPLSNKRGRVDHLGFAFGSFHGRIQKFIEDGSLDLNDLSMRQSIAYQVQNAIFDHITNKLKLTLEAHKEKVRDVKHFVASGGVASNILLRKNLDSALEGTNIIETFYPKVALCTDNAVMIGWAGIELYEKFGLTTDLSVCPINKWPLSDIMNVPGWLPKEQ